MFRLTSAFAKPALQQSKSLLLPKEVPFRLLGQQYVLTKPTQIKCIVPSFSFSSNTHNKSKGFSGPNRGTPRPTQPPANNRLKEILDVFAYKYRKGSLSKEETIRLLVNIGKLVETPIPGLKPSETIKYLTEALILAEKVGITDAIELGHIYNVIFILYFTAGNLEKAEEFVNNATAIYAKAVESGKAEGHARLIETQFATANIYNKREELDKARDIFLEIESKKEQIPKEDLVHCMPLLYDGLGDICFKKRELAEVTKYREKAIAEVVKNFGEDSKEIVYYLNKLTDALVQEGDLSRALENAQRTLETSLKHNGEYSQESTSARIRVAMIYMRRKEYDEGLKHYEKAMEVIGKLANYSKEQILQDRILLARAYFETGREQQANQIVNVATKQLIEEVGEGPQVAQFYSSWGETLITKDNTKAEGVSYLQKALDIYNKLASIDESLQIMKHYTNGKVLFYQGQGEESIKELNKAIELNFLAEKKPESMDKMYSFLGRVCLQFNKVNESIENFEKAIQVSEKDEHGFQDIEPYSGYVDLGMAYEQGNQLEKAAEAYQKALDLGVKRHSKESKMVLGLVQFLNNVLEKLGKHKEVEKLNEEYKIEVKESQ